MSVRRIAFATLVSALAVTGTNAARAQTLHTKLHALHGNAIHREYGNRESLPGVDLYPAAPAGLSLEGTLKEPGSTDRYMYDTRDGQPQYQRGSSFVTREFDLLPDSRPPN